MIKITFLDGNSNEFPENSSIYEIAKSISPSLAKNAYAGLVNDELYDLNRPITSDATVNILTSKNSEAFQVLNHSTAHLLAQALISLYPSVQLGIGPAIDEGFYYDVKLDETLKEEDLLKIEKEMHRLADAGHEIIRSEVSKDEALKIFKNNPYKTELINEIDDSGEKLSLYEQGDFIDLCRGGHVGNTKKIKHFKLLKLAGAYWRGDSDRDQMQRIYGTAWFTKEELENHLLILEERRQRDHRKLGKELKLFTFTDETGQGLPLWLPNGYTVRKQIEDYMHLLEFKNGYQRISTPTLGTKLLYETSGHWSHYQENMFTPIEMENETFVLRPMTCPHHMMVYKSEMRSYRDLPVRLAEFGEMYRFEASGGLTGLERVRAMTLNDAHIFVRPDQIKEEFKNAFNLVQTIIKKFKLEIDYIELALRDPEDQEKYHDDDESWNSAEAMLREVLNELNVDYKPMIGEAAFYGPKMDVQIKTAIGHTVTLSTIQLDFLLPERFNLEYVGEDGKKHRPVVIHRGIVGTFERFMATLIEQYKGAFPTWLAPTQIAILPVSNSVHKNYVEDLKEQLFAENFRVISDLSDEKLNYKIRKYQTEKIPYTLIIGDDEVKNETISFRKYGEEKTTTISAEEFLKMLKEEIKF